MRHQIEKNGYIILRNFYSEHELTKIKEEINNLGKFIFGYFDMDAENLELDQIKRSLFYKGLRYLTSLSHISCDEKNINLCQKLGLVFPAIMNACNIRMDTPDNKNLFQWHQDTTYLLGSLNALTFWIPLCKVDKINGTIELIPNTHNKGFYKFTKNEKAIDNHKYYLSPSDASLEKEPTQNIINVEANIGDLVIFNQMLLHRSTPNYSNKIRWSIQLRYSDLMNQKFFADGYPFGDVTNIFHTPYINYINKEELE